MNGEIYIEADLDPQVGSEARTLAARVVADKVTTYERATDLGGLLGVNFSDKVPTPLYLIWAELTDAWELTDEGKEPPAGRRKEVEGLMREAASDLVGANGPAALEDYFSKWCKRLGISRATVGRSR